MGHIKGSEIEKEETFRGGVEDGSRGALWSRPRLRSQSVLGSQRKRSSVCFLLFMSLLPWDEDFREAFPIDG